MVEFFIAGDNYDRRKIEQMLFPKDETAKTMERVYPWNWTFFFLATHLATADLGLEPQSTLSLILGLAKWIWLQTIAKNFHVAT